MVQNCCIMLRMHIFMEKFYRLNHCLSLSTYKTIKNVVDIKPKLQYCLQIKLESIHDLKFRLIRLTQKELYIL